MSSQSSTQSSAHAQPSTAEAHNESHESNEDPAHSGLDTEAGPRQAHRTDTTHSLAGRDHGDDPPAYCHRTDSYMTSEYRDYSEQYHQEHPPVWGLAAPLPHLLRSSMRPRRSAEAQTFHDSLPTIHENQHPVREVQSNVNQGTPLERVLSRSHVSHNKPSKQQRSKSSDPRNQRPRGSTSPAASQTPPAVTSPQTEVTDPFSDARSHVDGHVDQQISRHESYDFAEGGESESEVQLELSQSSAIRPGLAPIQNVPRPSLIDKPEIEELRKRLQSRNSFVPHQAREICRAPTQNDRTTSHASATHAPRTVEKSESRQSAYSQAQIADNDSDKFYNKWAKFRHQQKEPLSEFLAVFVMMTVGLSANLMYTINNVASPSTTKYGDFTSTNLVWSWATMAAIYIAGGVSGAHLSPVVTITLCIFRGFPFRFFWKYALVQFLGCLCAAFAVYGLYHDAIYLTASSNNFDAYESLLATTSVFQTSPTSGIGNATAFFNQLVLVALFTIVVLALGDDNNSPPGAGMNAFIVGLFVFVIACAFPYNTGASFNPFRDFAPRLMVTIVFPESRSHVWTERGCYWLWGCWAAPLCGGLSGALVYDLMVFTGGESPINYPDLNGRVWRWLEGKVRLVFPLNAKHDGDGAGKAGNEIEADVERRGY